LQVFGIKERPVKYYCYYFKRKLAARSKSLNGGKSLLTRKDVGVVLQGIEARFTKRLTRILAKK